MHDDEERLAALIDNELDDEEKAALLERLAQDPALARPPCGPSAGSRSAGRLL